MDSYWSSTYSDCEPISYRLRDQYRNRWIRFHTLPNSKRYADNEAEYRIILDRHNAILSELAISNDQLVFASTGYSETPQPTRDEYPQLNAFDKDAKCWRTISKHELDNDTSPNYWHLYMSNWFWTPGVFDSIFRLVADNVIANTMILSTSNHWIYHPYDGGADVVLPSSAERAKLKRKFNSWLSTRSDGL